MKCSRCNGKGEFVYGNDVSICSLCHGRGILDMETMRIRVRQKTTEVILDCLVAIQKLPELSTEHLMARAALIDVFAEREGEDAGDRLMDELGM